jgi:hypothetical protein
MIEFPKKHLCAWTGTVNSSHPKIKPSAKITEKLPGEKARFDKLFNRWALVSNHPAIVSLLGRRF